MREADRLCPINPFVRYKNTAISNIHCAIGIFLFSLYYWFFLNSRDRKTFKKGNAVRIVGKAYFVKETIIQDIHYL